ncbi:MAG: hypothetical protein WC391_07980 [Methanoregula sp.]|jgi:hypothetical protein
MAGIPVASLKGRVEQRYHLETFSDDEFAAWVDSAIRLYSRFNPVIKTEDVDSIAGQSEYSLPDDCIQVYEVYGVNVDSVDSFTLLDLSDRGGISKDEPVRYLTEKMLDAIGRLDLSDLWAVEGTNLVFRGGFTIDVETFRIKYGAMHALTNGWYLTVPVVDFDLIVDLIYADILEARGAEAAASEDYAEGLEKVTVSNIPKNTAWAISSLRNKLRHKYGGAAVAQGVM